MNNTILNEIINSKPLSKDNLCLGRKEFIPDFEKIEIDITFDCNLKCVCCNRSCGFAPSMDMMTLDDIIFFIKDSRDNHKIWKLINILGGEPTLHPNFQEIIELLQHDYAEKVNSDVIIQIVSNGVELRSREVCDKMEELHKNVRIDRESYKSNATIDYFTPFTDAPIDDEKFSDANYSTACWVAEFCGIGLNKNGYFACSLCGGIDRVLSSYKGIHSLSELSLERIKEHFDFFCRYCGNFKYYSQNHGMIIPRCEKAPFRQIISPTWEKIYENYNSH